MKEPTQAERAAFKDQELDAARAIMGARTSEEERRKAVTDWLASQEAERQLAEAIKVARVELPPDAPSYDDMARAHARALIAAVRQQRAISDEAVGGEG